MRYSSMVCCLWVSALSACNLLGGVQVNEIAGGSAPPAHITKVVTVSQHGKPVTHLRASAFRIEEEGQPLESKAIDLRLLPVETVIAFHTVLLMDLSPSSTSDGRSLLTQAASRFVQELRKRQSVTVLAFDGSEHTRVVGDFPYAAKETETIISEGRFASAIDGSRNLRGAVLEGLDRLESKRKQQSQPIRVGSLVVFSMGPDIASRIPEEIFEQRLSQSPSHVYFVGLKTDGDSGVPRELSRSGQSLTPDLTHLPEAFEEVEGLVAVNMDRHYVLTYCTPSRAGERSVRVAVDVVNDDLEVETGTTDSRFNATGFIAGCDSTKAPRSAVFKPNANN